MSSKSHFFNRGINLPFIATFRTTTGNENITLPYVSSGTYIGTIDWGDGTIVENSFINRTHTYLIEGDYDVVITGKTIGFAFNNSGDKLKIYDVKKWGNGIYLDANMFFGCLNLDITATDIPIINTNSLRQSFRDCDNLIWNDTINSWDVSSVTNLELTFLRSDFFNQPLNDWDVSNITSMRNCFQETTFNQPLNNWNTLSLINPDTMFKLTPFNYDISSWDFSNVGVNNLNEFMNGKTFNDYNSNFYDNLLIKWASNPIAGGLPNINIGIIDMGTIKYTIAGASARASILSNNKATTINDGGQI